MVYNGNPIKMGDLGVPLFSETPHLGFKQYFKGPWTPTCPVPLFSNRIVMALQTGLRVHPWHPNTLVKRYCLCAKKIQNAIPKNTPSSQYTLLGTNISFSQPARTRVDDFPDFPVRWDMDVSVPWRVGIWMSRDLYRDRFMLGHGHIPAFQGRYTEFQARTYTMERCKHNGQVWTNGNDRRLCLKESRESRDVYSNWR